MSKTVKVRLAFQNGKPVNFKFGETNITIGQQGSDIDQRFADLINKQLPGWIEVVPKKTAAKSKQPAKEA